jgi:hypothetical protein
MLTSKEIALLNRRKPTKLPRLRYILPLACAAAFAAAYTFAAAQHAVASERLPVAPPPHTASSADAPPVSRTPCRVM